MHIAPDCFMELCTAGIGRPPVDWVRSWARSRSPTAAGRTTRPLARKSKRDSNAHSDTHRGRVEELPELRPDLLRVFGELLARRILHRPAERHPVALVARHKVNVQVKHRLSCRRT